MDGHKLIGELVMNKYGNPGIIIDYNYIFGTYMVEWYSGSSSFKSEHVEHKIKEYLTNVQLNEEIEKIKTRNR
jgi:uncharacterized protein YodC (DUF2158 family)